MRGLSKTLVSLGLLALLGCGEASARTNTDSRSSSLGLPSAASAVQDLVATQCGAGLYLTWDAAPNATGYEIFYGVSDDLTAAVSVGASTVTSARLSPLSANTAYWVWVRATSAGGSANTFPGAFASVPAQTGE